MRYSKILAREGDHKNPVRYSQGQVTGNGRAWKHQGPANCGNAKEKNEREKMRAIAGHLKQVPIPPPPLPTLIVLLFQWTFFHLSFLCYFIYQVFLLCLSFLSIGVTFFIFCLLSHREVPMCFLCGSSLLELFLTGQLPPTSVMVWLLLIPGNCFFLISHTGKYNQNVHSASAELLFKQLVIGTIVLFLMDTNRKTIESFCRMTVTNGSLVRQSNASTLNKWFLSSGISKRAPYHRIHLDCFFKWKSGL